LEELTEPNEFKLLEEHRERHSQVDLPGPRQSTGQ